MRRSEGSRTTHYQMRRVRLSGAVVFSMPLVAYRGGGVLRSSLQEIARCHGLSDP